MDIQPGAIAEMRERVDRIFNKYQRLVSMPLDFGTGEELFPSEVHVIEAIGSGKTDTVTGLASALGITKGAVSQVATKLEAKGYLIRGGRAASREVGISLTDRGKKAFRAHARLHAGFEASLASSLAGESPRDIAVFARLLGKLEDHLDDWASALAARR